MLNIFIYHTPPLCPSISLFILFVAVFLGYNQYWPDEFMVFVVLCPGAPDGSKAVVLVIKHLRRWGHSSKVSSDRLGEAGNRTCDPWFTRHRFIPYTMVASFHPFIFLWPCSLAISYNQNCPGGFMVFVFFYVQEHPKAHGQWFWF